MCGKRNARPFFWRRSGEGRAGRPSGTEGVDRGQPIHNPRVDAMAEIPDDFLMLIVLALRRGQDDALQPPPRRAPDLRFSVSHTTRRPRAAEVDGRDYHFVDAPPSSDGARGRVRRVGARPRQPLRHQPPRDRPRPRRRWRGDLRHRLPGGAADQGKLADAVGVFILPPRSPSSSGACAAAAPRARSAGPPLPRRREIEHYGIFDYVVVNDQLDRAYEDLQSIVLAERCRRARHARRCERMLLEGKADR